MVSRSVCQRWPSCTSWPSHTHPRLTHSHPSRYFTRVCNFKFCHKEIRLLKNPFFMISEAKHLIHYLSFQRVQALIHLFHLLLQHAQPVIYQLLRCRFRPLRRSWRPQNGTSLPLIALHVLGIIVGLLLQLVVRLTFTGRRIGMKLLTGVSLNSRTMDVCVLRGREVIWKRNKAAGDFISKWMTA